jgi:hypothetical protein
VTEYLTNELLVQSMKGVDIVQKRTRLTKLVCRYVNTGLLVQDGKILPNLASVGSSEQLRRTLSQPPTRPESGMEVRPPSDTMFPDQQGPISCYNAPQSQQPYRAVESHTNTAKRRKVSGNEGLQTPAVCPTATQQNNGSTTQAEGQHCSTGMPIHPEQQHNTAPLFEEAGNIEHGRLSLTSHVATHGDLVPTSEEMEVSQSPTTSFTDRANYDKDTTLPSYGLSDLFVHDRTSYCFGAI